MPRRKVTEITEVTETAETVVTPPAPPTPPAPKLVRQCADYDPARYMIRTTYPDTNVETEYLEVRYRVDWFLHWCAENGHEAMFDESEFKLYPEIGLVIATCAVYLDDKLVSKSTAGREFTDERGGSVANAVQTAFTFAKGRALSILGFGTINGNKDENGESVPPDMGNDVTPNTPKSKIEKSEKPVETTTEDAAVAPAAPAEPVAPSAPADPTPPDVKKPRGRTPASKKVEQSVPTTLAEAQAVKFTFGKNKGMSVGEVWVTDPNNIKWLLSDAFGRKNAYPAEIEACRIVSSQT